MPDFNQMQRRRLAAKRQAMPDGGFPIRNVADLKNAIQAFGRAKNKPAVKAWIKKRARELGATNLLPDSWRDDVLVHDGLREVPMWTYNYTYPNYICHHGIKGMKWGVRRYQNEDGSLTAAGKKRAAKGMVKSYRKSRKTDPKTDFLKLNRANSAARTYYRQQRTRDLRAYRNAGHNLDKKVVGLSKEQIENGRYRVARARNIKRKTLSVLTATGVTIATGGLVPLGVLAGVGMNYVSGGHYYQSESATYGTRRASRTVATDEKRKALDKKNSSKK